MNLQIERPYVEAMITEFPRLAPLQDQLRFGNKITMPFNHLSGAELGFLGNLYREAGPAMRTRAAQLATLQQAFDGQGTRFSADDDLEMLMPAIAGYLATDALRGWLFRVNMSDKPLAYVVTRLDYIASSNDETGKVVLELRANAKGTLATAAFRISATDIVGRTVAEIFAAKGYVRESAELVTAYDDSVERYFDWRGQYGAQFSARGTGFYAEDPTATHRDTDWSRKDVVVLSSGGGATRLVNDEGILSARTTTLEATGDILGPYLRKAAKSNQYNAETEVGESQAAMPTGLFTKLPVHPYLFMFHLDLHHYLWVHVDDIALYEYQPALKQKLILPPEQTDLIDILTAEMDVLMDDIVAGPAPDLAGDAGAVRIGDRRHPAGRTGCAVPKRQRPRHQGTGQAGGQVLQPQADQTQFRRIQALLDISRHGTGAARAAALFHMTSQQENPMQACITFEGEHVDMATPDEIAAGIEAANEVFARHNVDPLACAAAKDKLAKDELLTREEAMLCVIWETAEDKAFRAVTLNWLVRGETDIWLTANQSAP